MHNIRLLLASLLVLLVVAPAAAARPLEIGITDPLEGAFDEVDGPGAYAAARAAGIRVSRLPVAWSNVVVRRPSDPTDPADRGYRWDDLDARVDAVIAGGLEPLLSVYSASGAARPRGPFNPSPDAAQFGHFMTALARRYSGGFAGRPRVRLFQLWNEPNNKSYLDQSDAPQHYRAMVNAAYAGVKGVHQDNTVVAGGTAPFAGPDGRYGVGPLKFMRDFLAEPVSFDVWSHHPYTSGPPARHAAATDDASIADLPKVRRLLRKAGHGRARLWVTEFSWDSTPPDPFAVPVREHARWVAEGLYRMWRSGVSLVVWFQLRDNPKGTFTWGQTFQSGLYFKTTDRYVDERAKPALRAVQFPFVALPAGRRVTLWGRTPGARRGRAVIERRSRGRWRRVTSLRADRDGIFRGTIRRSGLAPLRARLARESSLPFVPRRTRDRFVNPFGGEDPP